MRARIPIYVEERGGRYRARPLFHDEPEVEHERLQRALDRLGRSLRDELLGRLGQARHEDAAALLWSPRRTVERAKLALALRRRTLEGHVLLVVVHAAFGRVAYTPSVPELWWSVARGEEVAARAAEALTEHFRRIERGEGASAGGDALPDALGPPGKAFAMDLEVEVRLPVLARFDEGPKGLAALMGGGPMEGSVELQRTGRLLDALFPDALARAARREPELGDLARALGLALAAPEEDPLGAPAGGGAPGGAHGRPSPSSEAPSAFAGSAPRAEPTGGGSGPGGAAPVLLVGPSGVGKTALVHELCRRTLASRGGRFAAGQRMWLVSPMRLIAGMMYVGQWESRVEAILRVCESERHILVIEDVLGLYDAGLSSASQLAVAHVLKPWLERRRVRVVAAMTEEALRVLREVDRGMADLFHVIRVAPPSETETLRIGIHAAREVERRHGCRFAPDLVPLAVDLARRFLRERASPGAAVDLLGAVGAAASGGEADPDDLYEVFEQRTGLQLSLFGAEGGAETDQVLSREAIEGSLARSVLGQPEAVRAAAEAISIARARLGDPERPLASLLFTGPTGVGKTQLAKALARGLFGDPARLVRIDMNEHLDAGAVARLVGTFHDPEGQLTAAVRRQPFAVVLFDEVEKAHPDVLDLLLQVLGHGRLTDARGRSACFRGALVVLTSNLGAREAEAAVGFAGRGDDARAAAYVAAAERFFRPELLNRIDRIVPFRPLAPDSIGALAALEAERLFAREGLARRRSVLEVHEGAIRHTAERGYHGEMGARALKRAVERELARPLAAELAALPPTAPALIELFAGTPRVRVALTALEPPAGGAPPLARAPLDRPAAALDGLALAVERMRAEMAPLGFDGASPAGLHAIEVRERIRLLGEAIDDLDQRLSDPAPGLVRRPLVRAPGGRTLVRLAALDDPARRREAFAGLLAAEDPRAEVRRLSVTAGVPAGEGAEHAEAEVLADRLAALAWESAYLDALAAVAPERIDERALVWVRAVGPLAPGFHRQVDDLEALFAGGFELAVARLPEPPDYRSQAFVIQGPLARLLAAAAQGARLLLDDDGGGALRLAQVLALPVEPGERPEDALARLEASRAAFVEALRAGRADLDEDPLPLGPIVRVEGAPETRRGWWQWPRRLGARPDAEAAWRSLEVWRGEVIDLRAGLALSRRRTLADERLALLARLPLPAELTVGAG